MPKLIKTPFAAEAEAGYRTDIQETTGEAPNSATYQIGFPPNTMQSITAGGIPPKGADMNGILYDITDNIVFQTQGGRYGFDSAYATSIGGYPLNAILQLNDGAEVISTIANNTNDPNSNMTGWRKIPLDTIESIQNYASLLTLSSYIGKLAFVRENVSDGLGSGVYEYTGSGWVKKSDNLTVFDFGASDTGDTTLELEAAANYTDEVELPENYTFSSDNSNFDTSKFYGNGSLKFINNDRVMKAEYRKGANRNGILTLEDEFGQHVNANNRYSGFGCSSLANGKEYVAVRCGQNHFYNASVPSYLVMYIIDRNKNNAITKQVLLTSAVGQDIRDINVSLLPQFGNRLLIKYAMQTSASTYDTYLMVYNCTNDSVEYTRKVLLPSNQFTWGNSLITPSGFILIPSYGIDGSTVLYRSNAAYNYTQETDLAVTLVATFETSGSAEPTICYYDDQLVIFYRMGTGVNGKFNKTYNLEGSSGWGASVSLSREVHAPYVDPYNFGKTELLMMCSLGNARSLLATFATQNLETWYSTARLLVAGNTTLAPGQTGGYPSFVDYGENLSVQSYADFRSSDMTLTSRLDVRLIKKNVYSALNSYEAQRITYENSSLAWGEYSLGTSAATIDIAIGLKRSLSVTKARIRMTGVSANTFAEILNSSGAVVATSAVASINTTTFQDVEFTFPSTALTAGNYSVRIQRRDTANPLVFSWNTSSIVKKRIIKNKIVDILGLVSSSSSTLWNNAGIHVDLF